MVVTPVAAAVPLALKSLHYRRRMLEIIKHAGAGHTGGGLSCIDILNVLYNRILNVSPSTFTDPRRDRYIQSKGHCVEALYVVLADRGFFATSELETLCLETIFAGLPNHQAAELLGLSERTAKRNWAYARAWLAKEIEQIKDR